MTAEPMERAGLTLAPDRLAEAKWMATRVNGMARAARLVACLVAARMTAMKPAVSTISMSSAPISVIPLPGLVTPAVTAACDTATMTSRPAARAPTTWATM